MLAQCGVMLRSSPSPVATVVLVAIPLAVLPASTPGLVWALVLVLDAVDDDGGPSLVDSNQHFLSERLQCQLLQHIWVSAHVSASIRSNPCGASVEDGGEVW